MSLIDLRTLRGQVLGRISDYEAAADLAEGLVREAPTNPSFLAARARAASTFHRFAAALADLAEAERLGLPANEGEGMRAGILQALGRSDEALAIRSRIAASRPDVQTLADEAVVRGARGQLEEAERLFADAVTSYRDVSPFPIAWIEFQRGLMWMREGEPERARAWLATAHARLPQHVQVAGHLAEVEALLGHTDAAVALLRSLAESVEDPDYAAQLARILDEADRVVEAVPWQARAAEGYDELMVRHPDAYADHAAEFWLAAGNDPERALAYAERNLALRPTVRAWELVLRAARAAGDSGRACAAARGARGAGHVYATARTVVDETLSGCPADAD